MRVWNIPYRGATNQFGLVHYSQISVESFTFISHILLSIPSLHRLFCTTAQLCYKQRLAGPYVYNIQHQLSIIPGQFEKKIVVDVVELFDVALLITP